MTKEIIIIANDDVAKMLLVIMKSGAYCDEIELQFMDRYEPTVEYIFQRLLRTVGWIEDGRDQRMVNNNKCIHNQNGVCAHPKNNDKRVRCIESVRAHCEDYQLKNNSRFVVNTLTMKKIGAIRGIE